MHADILNDIARVIGADTDPVARGCPQWRVGAMGWTWRPWRRKERRAATLARIQPDYGAASGRHRLSDGDVVPVNGRRWVDYLPTAEHPVINKATRPLMTPAAEHRSGARKWLR